MHEHIEMLIDLLSARAQQRTERRRERTGRRRAAPPVLPRMPRHRAWGDLLVSPFVHRHPRRATFVAPS